MSIYDSHEVIVNELQVLLAGRLLALESYDAVKEIEIVELLKVRFGESTLQICDVMLKDIADSERIDKHIRTEVEVRICKERADARQSYIPSSSLACSGRRSSRPVLSSRLG